MACVEYLGAYRITQDFLGLRSSSPMMENRMEHSMETEIEAGVHTMDANNPA